MLAILDALHVGQRRTRVLAASIRSLEVLEEVVRKVSQRPAGLLDVTLPFSLLSGLLDDPVTRQAADIFAELP